MFTAGQEGYIGDGHRISVSEKVIQCRRRVIEVKEVLYLRRRFFAAWSLCVTDREGGSVPEKESQCRRRRVSAGKGGSVPQKEGQCRISRVSVGEGGSVLEKEGQYWRRRVSAGE
jgi:hypothetical protein